MTDLVLPNKWRPRYYQKPLWKYLENGGKRAYAVWHRRAGKDDLCLHWTATAAMERVGNYWHMLPEAAQARKAIWKAVNPHTGQRRIDEAFPLALRKSTNETEMFIEFLNGSTWQVLGSDNYNSQVGSAPVGIIFSEWALADPQAWAYMRPILAENGGWALFITTPRGRNHAARMYQNTLDDEAWFTEKLSADKTGVFSNEVLAGELRELIQDFGTDEGTAKYQQEYFCSFDAALPGAYYGTEMNKAENDGRISGVPYDPRYEVYPIFDLGHRDSTAIVFAQIAGREPRVIDYHESSGQNIDFYAKLLREKKYAMPKLVLPHDAGNGQLGTGTTYAKQFMAHGFQVQILPRTTNINADINLARQLIGQMWIDAKSCSRLVDCLRNYHREWDAENKIFKPMPKHDWSSHGADAFRYFAVAHNIGALVHNPKPTAAQHQLESGRMAL